MPLYEYKCEKCEVVFERLQRYSDDPVTVHEGCGGNVVKLLSAPGFHFKGSGWYATDYAKSGAKPEGKTDSNTGEKTESKSEGSGEKSDAKPASESKESKSESKPVPATKPD